MHAEEKAPSRAALHRYGVSLFRSQSSTPRSASPRSFQLYELLHARRMHSFTRRMKSFNKDRNPDLALHPPSYMRQTCSSLIKRHGLCDQDSNRRTKTGKSRRTTSIGGTTSVRRKGTKEQRRAYSSLEHTRRDSMSFAPNDTLGFLLEEMPEGLSWVQGYGTDVALNGQSSVNRSTHGERPRRHSTTQHSHRRHVSFDGALNDLNPKTTNAVNVRSIKTKPRALNRKAGCPSRPRSGQVKQQSVDLRSDTANNSSSGNYEDVVPATERLIGRTSRRPRPRSALPVIERGAANGGPNKQTSKRASTKKTAMRRMSQPQNSSGRESTTKQSSSPVQSFSQELSINHEALAHDEEPSELSSEIDHRTQEQNRETTKDVCSVESDKVADEERKSAAEGEEVEGDVVHEEMTEEDRIEEEPSEEDWRPMTYTTRPAEEIFPVAPVAIDVDQFSKEIRTQESHEGYCDALSKSLQSSEDSTSESNSESASESNEPCVETVSDNSQSGSETEPSEREMSREFERTARVLPVKKRRRHFLRLRRRERLSPEEDTSQKQDPRRAQLTKETRTRSPLVSRWQCCRIPFKACFCGADVSPGPATDDDDDSPHQAVYFSE